MFRSKVFGRSIVNFDKARQRMVEEQLIVRGIQTPRVVEAMRKVPRHLFVEEAFWDRAYGDHALPIGEKQTISQPYMVARMTEALELTGAGKVLEIGTGSGYQTAILAELTVKVRTVERVRSLHQKAQATLNRLQYFNVAFKLFDGTYGWPEEAPFDAIIVTAGAPDIPPSLLDQLKPGGSLVIPVGDRRGQMLKKIVKGPEGLASTHLTNCVFVPLVGAFGWQSEGSDNGLRAGTNHIPGDGNNSV
jgi:protein-L-isoaspartate(D-aspartate) O-methyltransferase